VAPLNCRGLEAAQRSRHITHLNDGFVFLGHRIIRKRGPPGGMRQVTKIPWDNWVTERFFLNLKMERIWQHRYANHDEARADINQYIVSFFN
jgi:hypothetical protein